MKKKVVVDFEKPIFELHAQIDELKNIAETNKIDLTEEIERMEKRAMTLKQKIYENLAPDQIIKVARHPERPTTFDYIGLVFSEFIEIHGDRLFGDDPSIISGFATLDDTRVVVIGHQKGKDTKDKIYRNFGMPQPEGYRKAMRVMKLAEKFGLPIITFIDTPGAFPGIEAEERGQAEAIARNLHEMSGLKVPVISIVTGEGGSGGALGIAVANEVLILEYAVYSVISPEGCAAILWNDAAKASEAARSMKITAKELKQLGIVDEIIPEPLGGAHNDHEEMATRIKKAINDNLKKYKKMKPDQISDHRYDKFRAFGFFNEPAL
ncbi:MAG: acetyl-CoA carboxylase carboxyl transferase subunit alpha [Candidatus Margulisiibacteriota bacterium]|nr:MAG: acetyl-CoA carboxylase carboxyltransferase subunit alpha [Candidatus Margulisbacteria bacterium GWD2_39_127]OGI02493.1 MAG: acetyl-CoA carboxylase carboxyltransferase subunit alpha [Candidatus Margulisbacteria bacterium GWF2_38_17]OGI10986.1 MAG: acetyl-CoA carboxylase carboxyltransferase subunit alpha [Candidatus Margulisbacteria bacterium GWE2_39_32]PZM83180.1 MAG: acetyl-CoA carboxylase carboxyl transferase subunit alpha [Candidatus Margulisiibacteriota bacterium]HAR62517.1 acetyl-Co